MANVFLDSQQYWICLRRSPVLCQSMLKACSKFVAVIGRHSLITIPCSTDVKVSMLLFCRFLGMCLTLC